MKFYVTARSTRYDLVKETFERIKNAGHEVVFEWTAHAMIKPYSEHEDEASDFAQLGISGVTEADVYIVFAHNDGNGVFTEFGAALASHVLKGSPRIFAIGNTKDTAMFNYHPAVEWCDSLEEVFVKLKL